MIGEVFIGMQGESGTKVHLFDDSQCQVRQQNSETISAACGQDGLHFATDPALCSKGPISKITCIRCMGQLCKTYSAAAVLVECDYLEERGESQLDDLRRVAWQRAEASRKAKSSKSTRTRRAKPAILN